MLPQTSRSFLPVASPSAPPSLLSPTPFILLVLLGDLVGDSDQHDVLVEEYVLAEIEAPDQGDAELAADCFLGMATSALWNAT